MFYILEWGGQGYQQDGRVPFDLQKLDKNICKEALLINIKTYLTPRPAKTGPFMYYFTV